MMAVPDISTQYELTTRLMNENASLQQKFNETSNRVEYLEQELRNTKRLLDERQELLLSLQWDPKDDFINHDETTANALVEAAHKLECVIKQMRIMEQALEEKQNKIDELTAQQKEWQRLLFPPPNPHMHAQATTVAAPYPIYPVPSSSSINNSSSSNTYAQEVPRDIRIDLNSGMHTEDRAVPSLATSHHAPNVRTFFSNHKFTQTQLA